jgi:hypothetical protein
MRARKNEIEELKQQLQRYSNKENDNKRVSLPPYINQQNVDSNAREEVGSTYR